MFIICLSSSRENFQLPLHTSFRSLQLNYLNQSQQVPSSTSPFLPKLSHSQVRVNLPSPIHLMLASPPFVFSLQKSLSRARARLQTPNWRISRPPWTSNLIALDPSIRSPAIWPRHRPIIGTIALLEECDCTARFDERVCDGAIWQWRGNREREWDAFSAGSSVGPVWRLVEVSLYLLSSQFGMGCSRGDFGWCGI